MVQDGFKFKKGDVVRWVGPPVVFQGRLEITGNDVREVVEVKPGVALLTRPGVPGGSFGWVSDLMIEHLGVAA